MKPSSPPFRILTVGAHPDDWEFGVGGILLKECDAGAEISLLVTSMGEAGSKGNPSKRKSEALAAAKLVGDAPLKFLNFGGDGQQSASPANAIQVARHIRKIKPTLVLAPLPAPNQHPDHAAVGQATRDACRLARYGGLKALKTLPPQAVDSLWYYSVTPGPDLDLSRAILIDVSPVIEGWKSVMACHASQNSLRPYSELQISRARQLGLMAGCEYATALWPNDPPVLQSLRGWSQAARSF